MEAIGQTNANKGSVRNKQGLRFRCRLDTLAWTSAATQNRIFIRKKWSYLHGGTAGSVRDSANAPRGDLMRQFNFQGFFWFEQVVMDDERRKRE